VSTEDFKRRRERLNKRGFRLSYEQTERLCAKYHGLTIRCPICGKFGRLCFKVKGSESKRYFYCRHGNDTCYVCRIEDVEELFNPSKESSKQTALA